MTTYQCWETGTTVEAKQRLGRFWFVYGVDFWLGNEETNKDDE
jgi:hypothetical protein